MKTYLLLVSRRAAGCKNPIANTARRKMIQYGMIRKNEHTSVISHRWISVENTLCQEHG